MSWFPETIEYPDGDSHMCETVRSSSFTFAGVQNCYAGSVCDQRPPSATSGARRCQRTEAFITSGDAYEQVVSHICKMFKLSPHSSIFLTSFPWRWGIDFTSPLSTPGERGSVALWSWYWNGHQIGCEGLEWIHLTQNSEEGWFLWTRKWTLYSTTAWNFYTIEQTIVFSRIQE
jgi:hypothetical protein